MTAISDIIKEYEKKGFTLSQIGLGLGVGTGITFGAAIGAAIGNVGMGVSFGLIVGAVIGNLLVLALKSLETK